MKYKLEFHPNPDCMSIHIQKRICDKIIETFDSPDDMIEIWKNNKVIGSKTPPIFVKRLWEINGIQKISLYTYSISLVKGTAFDWNDMIEQIIAILNLELYPDSEPEMLEKPKKPSRQQLKRLREQGCDV